jgi:hypothetical protein
MILTLGAPAFGASPTGLSEPVVRLRIESYAMTRAEPEGPDRVIFDPDPIRGAIEIVLSPLARTSHTLPAEAWWESAEWQIERLPIASEEFEADERDLRDLIKIGGSPTRQIGPGESIRADFVSEGWPTGVYRVKISLGEIGSDVRHFVVSAGDETVHLQREFARHKVFYRSRSRDAMRNNLMELAAMEPENPWPLIRLGDFALADQSIQTIDAYYRRALELLERRRDRVEGSSVGDVTALMGQLQRVRDHLPRLAAQRDTLILYHDVQSGAYILAERESRRVIERIGKGSGRP